MPENSVSRSLVPVDVSPCLKLVRPELPHLIAFQGELGANSHIACQNTFPNFKPVPCETFEDTLMAIHDERVALGMIPIENTVAGRVADIHKLLPQFSLSIVGEYFLPVHHQLLGLPGTQLDELKIVQSHIHALGQCRETLNNLGLKQVIASDTAGSARFVASNGDKTHGAIATTLAGEIYGLDVLKSNIEDEHHNTTRFLFLTKNGKYAPKDTQGIPVTTFIFQVRNIPAALYKCLGGFATNNINMTKLESYQIEGTFVATQFYADVEGHPDDRDLNQALDELRYFSQKLQILGVYPGGAARYDKSMLTPSA